MAVSWIGENSLHVLDAQIGVKFSSNDGTAIFVKKLYTVTISTYTVQIHGVIQGHFFGYTMVLNVHFLKLYSPILS